MKEQQFIWETAFWPTHGQIEEEQAKRGYHPAGYGGPNFIKIDKVETIPGDPPKYKTTWSCYGSCD